MIPDHKVAVEEVKGSQNMVQRVVVARNVPGRWLRTVEFAEQIITTVSVIQLTARLFAEFQ